MCFYTPTTVDGIANQVPEFSYTPNNSNQRCITLEFSMGLFIWFIISLCNIVFSMAILCAYKTESHKCFKFFNSLMSCGGCLGFIVFILLSCSRWSEAGRACSGEFMTAEAQPENKAFYDNCASIGAQACKFDLLDANGDVTTTYFAPTIATGHFLQIILILSWTVIGLVCCCCCMTMCCCMGMKKKQMAAATAADARGAQVLQTDASASANVSASNM